MGAQSDDIRKKMRVFFRSTMFHVIEVILISIDLMVVLTDIILLLIYCDNMPDTVEEAVHEFGIFSICLLSVFLLEQFCQMFAFGVKQYLSNCLHAFDFVVILITFIFEIIAHSMNGNEKFESMVGLLIGFRLWRLVRVIHITTEALDLKKESRELVEEIKEKIAILQENLGVLQGEVAANDNDNNNNKKQEETETGDDDVNDEQNKNLTDHIDNNKKEAETTTPDEANELNNERSDSAMKSEQFDQILGGVNNDVSSHNELV